MRLGIALPPTGPLSAPAAIQATARAAQMLDYVNIWSDRPDQLVEAVSCTDTIPTALLLSDDEPTDGVLTRAVALLGARLCAVAMPMTRLPRARAWLPTGSIRMFSTSATAPITGTADGWAPVFAHGAPPLSHPDRPLLVVPRIFHRPTPGELEAFSEAAVDQLVVCLPDAGGLDEQLAVFAEIAESVELIGVRFTDPAPSPSEVS